jgi:hypothetical protein
MKMAAIRRELTRRVKSWTDMKNGGGLDTKPRSRYDAGGYKCPGSMKKK